MPLQQLTHELVEEIARQYPTLQSLNLSQNALLSVQHLALLPSLLRVDLSANRLRAFPSPQELGACCGRLEFLDLSRNAIESLQHADACANLRALDVGDNQIELFSELRFLAELEHLEALTLQGNPVAQHATYRREVLAVLPQLKSLDGNGVTPAERLYLRLHRKPGLLPSASPAIPSPIETQASAPSSAAPAAVPITVADAAVSPVSSSLLLTPDNSRVAALESILSIQDRAIQRGLVEVARAHTGGDDDGSGDSGAADIENAAQLYSHLLAAWRQKTVSLMVQMKSMDLRAGDASRDFERQAREIRAARDRLEQECELWKQKHADAEAQRDLERVRAQESQQQRAVADSKTVSAVRTLSLEREKLQQVAETVAFFSARDGVMVGNMEALYAVARRLEAFERRLHYLGERIKTAAGLLAHREARLRNSEAAIDAERRIWSHRFEQMKDKRALGDTQSSDFGASAGDGKAKFKRSVNGARRFLRPATEAAFRELFHRLDPYDTGLVKAQSLLDALRADVAVLSAVGGQAKHEKLVAHIEKAVRQRSVFGSVGGSITWGELLLFFMPEGSDDSEAVLRWSDEAAGDALSSVAIAKSGGDVTLPPPFQSDVRAAKATAVNSSQRRLEKKALDSMTRDELVKQVLFLQDDRNQLTKRVLDDARELRRRATSIQKEWKEKVEQLVEKNEELQRGFSKQQQKAQRLATQLELAERNHGEAKHQLESLRRELFSKDAAFARTKEDMAAQHETSLLREQEIWRKELKDVNFSHSLLKTEHQKQELHVRHLERELSKRNDALVANETQRIAHLEDKLSKRDAEIAKLRRERNTILGTLRENERKLALQRVVVTASAGSQTEKEVVDPPLEKRTVGCQTTAAPDRSQHVRSSGLRMSIDEISETQRAVRAKATEQLTQDEISRRLRDLQSLTESLLDD